MAGLKEELRKLRDPANIKYAGLASSPYVLRKVFAADRRIRRIIEHGAKALPEVEQVLRERGKLSETSLAAFAFIVENIDPNAAPSILGPVFRKKLEKPGPSPRACRTPRGETRTARVRDWPATAGWTATRPRDAACAAATRSRTFLPASP